MRALIGTLGGVAVWVTFVVRHLSVYRGTQRFYALAQSRGPMRRAASSLLEGPLGRAAVDFAGYRSAVKLDRISPMAQREYSDDSLAGYADAELTKGGADLTEQQRGLILPLLEEVLATMGPGATVVEIGAGNGDVVAHLAAHHPELRFVGVDLSVATAERKHAGAPNLSFHGGYALDLLEAGELSGELVFASSTFVVFTPLELARYVAALRQAGFARIVLNEPTWAAHRQTIDGDAASMHLEGACWFHNYAGYLRREGYATRHFDFRPYRPPGSPRRDIFVLTLGAEYDPEAAGTPQEVPRSTSAASV